MSPRVWVYQITHGRGRPECTSEARGGASLAWERLYLGGGTDSFRRASAIRSRMPARPVARLLPSSSQIPRRQDDGSTFNAPLKCPSLPSRSSGRNHKHPSNHIVSP